MAEMKTKRYTRAAEGMTVKSRYRDELAESDEELTGGVPYPTNSHPEQQYMNMSDLLPMRTIIKDEGDGKYTEVTPQPSLSAQVRDQLLTQNTDRGSLYGRAQPMTFYTALKKDDPAAEQLGVSARQPRGKR